MSRLPDKPSELIELALEDMAKVEAQPDRYQVHMLQWHAPMLGSRRCIVCFAGAVMAGTLGVPDDLPVDPDAFDDDTRAKLLALDAFRQGRVSVGLGNMGMRHIPGTTRTVTRYAVSSARWREDMTRLARELREAGL